MKKLLFVLALAVLLVGCGAEPIEIEESIDPETCEHQFGEKPVQTVGNLDIFECRRCGYQKVVANGILLE